MEKLSKLLFELSNEDRLRILQVLTQNPTKLTPLSSALELTVQETSRHLSRMTRARLIQKGSDGAYSVTPYGEQLQEVLPTLAFLQENQDYFMTHKMSTLPREFISRMGDLVQAELTDNAIILLQNVDGLISRAKEFVWIMSDQASSSTFPLLMESLSRGATFRVILPEGIEAPDLPDELIPDFSKFRGELMEPRHLEKVTHVVILSESEAVLALPHLDGKLDYLGFKIDDDAGLAWCRDLFLYFWKQAMPVKTP